MGNKYPNNKNPGNKHGFDLEQRCLDFAKRCRVFTKKLPRTVENTEDRKQLTRSSGSIGANYIEANEALSKKDFSYRIKISRKECRESYHWLCLVDCGKTEDLLKECKDLQKEALELMKIFGSIYQKTK